MGFHIALKEQDVDIWHTLHMTWRTTFVRAYGAVITKFVLTTFSLHLAVTNMLWECVWALTWREKSVDSSSSSSYLPTLLVCLQHVLKVTGMLEIYRVHLAAQRQLLEGIKERRKTLLVGQTKLKMVRYGGYSTVIDIDIESWHRAGPHICWRHATAKNLTFDLWNCSYVYV